MKQIKWSCPICLSEYYADDKFAEVLKKKKDCKFCVRKDPNIPTTAEMDGLFTIEDMRTRFTVVFQCMSCNKWTIHKDYMKYEKREHVPCPCGKTNYDPSSIKGLRSYNPETDNKRRAKAAVKKHVKTSFN